MRIRYGLMRLFSGILALSGLTLPLAALAIIVPGSSGFLEEPPLGSVPDTLVGSVGDVYSIVCVAGEWLLVFGLAIGLIFIIWGGIKYITSAGDEAKAKEGKTTILYAIGGVIFLVLAVGIVNIIANFFGAVFFRFGFNCGIGFFGF